MHFSALWLNNWNVNMSKHGVCLSIEYSISSKSLLSLSSNEKFLRCDISRLDICASLRPLKLKSMLNLRRHSVT